MGISVPLSKTPPKGKLLVVIAPSDSLDEVTTNASAEAAATLGWQFKAITPTSTAQGVAEAMQSALQLRPLPFAIVVHGYAKSSFVQQLAQAKGMGVHIIVASTMDPGGTGDGIDASVDSGPSSIMEPTQVAAQVAVNSGGGAHVAIFDLPSYPIVHWADGVFEQKLSEFCPTCSTTVVPVQIQDLGTTAPQAVVSEVQQNPAIGYLFMLGPVSEGVAAALKSAGLSGKVKLVGMGPDPDNIQGLRDNDGINFAWSAYSSAASGWQVVDAAARLSVGDSAAPDDKTETPTQILTADNVGKAVEDSQGNYVGVANYQDIFKSLWHVSS
ncbi:MAG TPA: substrate-binding domain-containing protein [Streptosporangiaceae bacterium]|nr:substrate-binding domain-containing protein [Streptosporangiaceae bacterium]